MDSYAIRIKDVHYAYPPAVPGGAATAALQGISLEVEKAAFLAIVGPTGAGKTTLCLTLNGLVPQSTGGLFRGDVSVAGCNTKTTPVPELATHVGLVFQDSESQLFNTTVEDEVAFGAESLGLPVPEIERRIQWALDAVGLADLRARSPAHLSGGQQRRLAIAAVLAMQPDILVLDEPTAGLDPLARRTVLEVITQLRGRGSTVVMATQDIEAAATLADRVVVLEAGRIAMAGAPREVLEQVENLHARGVEAPQMARLSRCLGLHPACLTADQVFQALAKDRPAPSPDQSSTWTLTELQAGTLISRPDAPPGGNHRSAAASDPARATLTERARDTRPQPPSPGQIGVRFKDVWYRYETSAHALSGVDLDIGEGEFVALIGANGSGKTTLAKHVAGLLRPQRGRVLVGTDDTRKSSIGNLARQVGYVFQNPDHQIFAPSVREEIAFGPRNLGLDRAEIDKRVEAALDTFDLTSLSDLPPAVLGYGQRRLVTLAGVHAMRPRVLVLDEPTVGLDWRLTNTLVAWLSNLHRGGATILLITHDMQLASHASRCVAMDRGRVVLDTPMQQVFSHPEILTQAGIIPPPVVELGLRLGLTAPPANVEALCQILSRSAREVYSR
jgi:energy-coupling factor transporter ATP-binding protein EcfA2